MGGDPDRSWAAVHDLGHLLRGQSGEHPQRDDFGLQRAQRREQPQGRIGVLAGGQHIGRVDRSALWRQ
ncbi:MAG: hypothetical protein ACYC1E_02205 [Propionibacteriaceae bacterium]